MNKMYVNLSGIGATWMKPCQNAVTHLNALFKSNQIDVMLVLGSTAPLITVRTDPSIQGTAVHGNTTAETSGSHGVLRALVRLPSNVTINTPQGIRGAGAGVLEVIAAHEFVHALGHAPHNSHLMGQTVYKEAGDKPAGDKLKLAGVWMPPLSLSGDSIDILKSIWN
jgi:hypothetical protein